MIMAFEKKGRPTSGIRKMTCEEADLIGIRNNPYIGVDEETGEINFYYCGDGKTYEQYNIGQKILREHRSKLEYFWQKQNL